MCAIDKLFVSMIDRTQIELVSLKVVRATSHYILLKHNKACRKSMNKRKNEVTYCCSVNEQQYILSHVTHLQKQSHENYNDIAKVLHYLFIFVRCGKLNSSTGTCKVYDSILYSRALEESLWKIDDEWKRCFFFQIKDKNVLTKITLTSLFQYPVF